MSRTVILFLAVFFCLQALSADYGARINDLEHIASARISSLDLASTGLERPAVIHKTPGAASDETLDKWLLRFKLYSVESDEVNGVMALARIKPGALQFDPHFYEYGGAFLYPLGAVLFAGMKAGLIHAGSLGALLADPDSVDAIYMTGRLLVLLAFTLSAWIFARMVRPLTTPLEGLFLTGIYCLAPASVMFSQVMKPHWHLLLFVNLSLAALCRLFGQGRWSRRDMLTAGASLGLAVGSASVAGVYSILFWLALCHAARLRLISWRVLAAVPAVAILVFLAVNPYMLINWRAYQLEMQTVDAWFQPVWGLAPLGSFLWNSLFPGLGLGAGLLVLVLLSIQIIRPRTGWLRLYALALCLPLILVSGLTATMSTWHINFRFMPYALPLMLLLPALVRIRRRQALLGAVFLLTLLQSFPLLIAYHDENDPNRSTRLQSARWIAEHIPPGEGLCMESIAPYNTPPIDYAAYSINPPDCRYFVELDREQDHVAQPAGFHLAQRFTPRFSPAADSSRVQPRQPPGEHLCAGTAQGLPDPARLDF